MADRSAAGAVAGRASGESRRRRSDVTKRIVAASRQSQGLPPTVTDIEVLQRIASHLEQAAQGVPDEAA